VLPAAVIRAPCGATASHPPECLLMPETGTFLQAQRADARDPSGAASRGRRAGAEVVGPPGTCWRALVT